MRALTESETLTISLTLYRPISAKRSHILETEAFRCRSLTYYSSVCLSQGLAESCLVDIPFSLIILP